MFYTHFYFIGLKRAAKLAPWGAINVTIVLPFGLIISLPIIFIRFFVS